jgi:amino acid transporter
MARVQLRRELNLFDLMVYGVGGTVGTGALFSTAAMAALAGPGVVLAFLIGALFYAFVGFTYIELGLRYPEAGGPSRYSLYTHGRATNLINAVADLIWYLFIPPIEALASVEGLNFLYPHFINAAGNPTLAGAVLGVIFMLIYLPINYYGILTFKRVTNSLGSVKVLLYLLMAVGLLALPYTHFGNFGAYHGFMPFGFSGVFAAIPLGMFAFGGIRLIPDMAEEMRKPEDIRRSVLFSIAGQTVVYVLLAVTFIAVLDWHKLSLTPGDWGGVAAIPGNPFLTIASRFNVGWLVVVAILVAVIGPFVDGYVYQGGGSRVLFAMGRSQYVGARMKELHQQYAVPVWAILVFTVIGVVVAFIAAPFPSIYSLISDAVVAGYIGFSSVPVAMLSILRHGEKGIVWGGSVFAVLAFAASALIIYWSGWPSVPYGVLLLAIGAIGLGFAYRVGQGLKNALWYIVYILFLTFMSYIGGVGAKSLVNLDLGSLIVVVVSLAIFLPWGVASRRQDMELASRPAESEA